jgi:hypothetical protein
MNTMIKVARCHLVQPVLLVTPWATLALAFAVNAAWGATPSAAG